MTTTLNGSELISFLFIKGCIDQEDERSISEWVYNPNRIKIANEFICNFKDGTLSIEGKNCKSILPYELMVQFSAPYLKDATDVKFLNLTLPRWCKNHFKVFAKYEVNITFENVDTSNVVNMDSMFKDIKIVKGLETFDVSNVEDMSGMFQNTKNISDVSKWNTGNVKFMKGMFRETETTPDVSNWDVSSVIFMNEMFYDARGATPDVSNWDVSSVTDMSGMFAYAKTAPDVSNWNVRRGVKLNSMFKFTTVAPDVSNWDNAELDGEFFGIGSEWIPSKYRFKSFYVNDLKRMMK